MGDVLEELFSFYPSLLPCMFASAVTFLFLLHSGDFRRLVHFLFVRFDKFITVPEDNDECQTQQEPELPDESSETEVRTLVAAPAEQVVADAASVVVFEFHGKEELHDAAEDFPVKSVDFGFRVKVGKLGRIENEGEGEGMFGTVDDGGESDGFRISDRKGYCGEADETPPPPGLEYLGGDLAVADHGEIRSELLEAGDGRKPVLGIEAKEMVERRSEDANIAMSSSTIAIGGHNVEEEIVGEEGDDIVKKGTVLVSDEESGWEGIETSELEGFAAGAMNRSVEFGDEEGWLAKTRINDVIKHLYGLQKVAFEGPCQELRPMALMLSARAKWNSWKKVGNMTPVETMEQYITFLSHIVPPGWKTTLLHHVISTDQCKEEQVKPDVKKTDGVDSGD